MSSPDRPDRIMNLFRIDGHPPIEITPTSFNFPQTKLNFVDTEAQKTIDLVRRTTKRKRTATLNVRGRGVGGAWRGA